MDALVEFPLPFWLVIVLLAVGVFCAKGHLKDGSGLPMLAVLGTTAFWYIGDAYYNDYANNHAKVFDSSTLDSAWWQVVWFLTVFLGLTPAVHSCWNRAYRGQPGGILQMFQSGVGRPQFQQQLNLLFKGCVLIWGLLVVVAAIRLKDQLLYYFFPFLAYKAEPWGRGRMGSGFDALLSVALYFQLLVTSIFGVVAALATNRRVRWLALVLCLLTWPYFIFDRTRNTMLAVVVPGVLSWGILRVRGGVWKKVALLGVCFLVINGWMKFVIANRSNMTITEALHEQGFSLQKQEKVRHEGLNMYEELCWINTLMEQGTYRPNWGSRYFAEIVNPIPRSLWPGKPLIGIDYAIARGQGGGDAAGAEVWATMSTGMIGQGVVNFGRFLGPAAAALIMSFWVAALARLDLNIQRLGRLPLYAAGLILTFNLGRDITLITLYPFVFGLGIILLLERWYPGLNPQFRRVRRGQRIPRPVAHIVSTGAPLPPSPRA